MEIVYHRLFCFLAPPTWFHCTAPRLEGESPLFDSKRGGLVKSVLLKSIENWKMEGERKEEKNTTEEVYDTPITTRTGDAGTSSLYNGKRLPKSDIHFEALGSLDELNCFMGLSREFLSDNCRDVDDYLEQIQCILFSVCSAVATPLQSSNKYVLAKTTFDEKHVKTLEKWSCLLYNKLPPQNSFYLPAPSPFIP